MQGIQNNNKANTYNRSLFYQQLYMNLNCKRYLTLVLSTELYYYSFQLDRPEDQKNFLNFPKRLKEENIFQVFICQQKEYSFV